MGTVKFIGSWGCLITGIVLVILQIRGDLPMLLTAMSIAFALAPPNG